MNIWNFYIYMHCITSSLLKKLQSQIDSDFAETKISKDKIRDYKLDILFIIINCTDNFIRLCHKMNNRTKQRPRNEKSNRVSCPEKGKSRNKKDCLCCSKLLLFSGKVSLPKRKTLAVFLFLLNSII